MTVNRLVFGDDQSASADVAWGWVNAQDWQGWDVDVVTAVQTDRTVPAPELARLHPWLPDRRRTSLPEAQLGEISFLTAERDPRLLLPSHATNALLVIGARGTGVVEQMLFGSTADWLMRSPSGPMIIARDASPTRSVLVAVDGSHHARAAVRAFASLPWVRQTSCTVVSVVNSSEDVHLVCSETAEELRAAGAHVDIRVVELDDWQVDLNPAHRVLEEVREINPDLVVMGTKGRTGWSRLWYGSVAGAVAHNFAGNVLLARADAAA